ncbi:hypothetical protein KI387_036080, partial [Taxus chinensis]
LKAGGICTDGVWMTIRLDAKCLYVLMDFEGLGSFERTEQKDMLLSVLNAAISNLTNFNKKVKDKFLNITKSRWYSRGPRKLFFSEGVIFIFEFLVWLHSSRIGFAFPVAGTTAQ